LVLWLAIAKLNALYFLSQFLTLTMVDATLHENNLPFLSLCMIVKNEAENLPRYLPLVQPYVDEMVIIDTGSEDSTPEIAASYGAEVGYFAWCDDFAAARNYALSQVKGQWILMLDADEALVVAIENLKQGLRDRADILAYFLEYVEMIEEEQWTPSYRICLFRNLPEFSYVGQYHEVLQYQGQGSPSSHFSHLPGVKIQHYGFRPEVVKQKHLTRSIPMLERMREKDGLSIRLLYCLAAMYADVDKIERAAACSAEIFERLMPNLMTGTPPADFDFIPCTVFSLGVQALQQEDYETAQLLCQRGLEWCANYPPLNYLTGLLVKNLGFTRGSIAYFEYCLAMAESGSYYRGEPFNQSYMTTYSAYDLGCTYQELGETQKAIAAFETALKFDPNYAPAQEQLNLLT
jgi:tetratricopeptide (TPR) repeat protein